MFTELKVIIRVMYMADRLNRINRIHIMRIVSLILVMSFVFGLCSCKPNNSDFDGMKFSNTRTITVLSSATDAELEKYIHDSILNDCNLNVEFIPYATHGQPSGVVPDLAYSYDYNVLTTFYRMGSVKNIASYLDEYNSSLPYLTDMLGEENIHYCSDDHSEVWYLKARRPYNETRITFIRGDWLDKLGLGVPSTREEFHNCLVAFRDNAELLLGSKNALNMIPFMVDSEPNVSCKPLLDSFLDTNIDEMNIFTQGYCRATQPGYSDGLKVLNEWYLEGLLPSDFYTIAPDSKETYLPIESGYVGAFCGQCDYLYENGDNSHISSLKDKCSDATYIAVNTFENSEGEYTCWSEDYIEEFGRYVYMPSTCSDPLACLVYLNWISNPDNIEAMDSLATIKAFEHSTLDDYVLTFYGHYPDLGNITSDEFIQAQETADAVKMIRVANRCVRQGPTIFPYFKAGVDYSVVYPGSTAKLVCDAVSLPAGEFDDSYPVLFEEYIEKGARIIYSFRTSEWEKVINKGDMSPY